MEENKNELESKKLDENLVGETYGGYGNTHSGRRGTANGNIIA